MAPIQHGNWLERKHRQNSAHIQHTLSNSSSTGQTCNLPSLPQHVSWVPVLQGCPGQSIPKSSIAWRKRGNSVPKSVFSPQITRQSCVQLALAASKASYGWVAFTPSTAELDRFTATVRSTSTAFSTGSKHLHQKLFGAVRSLDVVIGVKQVTLWGKRLSAEQ